MSDSDYDSTDDNNLNNITTQSDVLSVRKFFNGKNVFITGATGFLGKSLIEKLIYSCDVNKIYCLIREKKNKGANERLTDLKEDQIFKFRLKNDILNEKLIAIAGDISLPELGISQNDRNILQNNVHIIIHSAATVRFDEPLDVAMTLNVKGTQAIIKLCTESKNLTTFVYVSTAFTACYTSKLEEKLYKPIASPYDLLKLLEVSEKDVFNKEIYDHYKGQHPNSYTFTKSLSEALVNDWCKQQKFTNGRKIATAIAKPAIIMSPIVEPMEYYVEGLSQGTPAVGASMGMGINRMMPGKLTNHFPGIPVDTVVNSLLIAATDVTNSKNNDENSGPSIYGIYNTTSNIITLDTAFRSANNSAKEYPSIKALRPVSMVNFCPNYNSIYYKIRVFFFEILFGLFMDIIARLAGGKPIVHRIMVKSHKTVNLLSFFLCNDWKVSGCNVALAHSKLSPTEQEIFSTNLDKVDWRNYFTQYWIGIRKWVFKEDLTNVKEARKRMQR